MSPDLSIALFDNDSDFSVQALFIFQINKNQNILQLLPGYNVRNVSLSLEMLETLSKFVSSCYYNS